MKALRERSTACCEDIERILSHKRMQEPVTANTTAVDKPLRPHPGLTLCASALDFDSLTMEMVNATRAILVDDATSLPIVCYATAGSPEVGKRIRAHLEPLAQMPARRYLLLRFWIDEATPGRRCICSTCRREGLQGNAPRRWNEGDTAHWQTLVLSTAGVPVAAALLPLNGWPRGLEYGLSDSKYALKHEDAVYCFWSRTQR